MVQHGEALPTEHAREEGRQGPHISRKTCVKTSIFSLPGERGLGDSSQGAQSLPLGVRGLQGAVVEEVATDGCRSALEPKERGEDRPATLDPLALFEDLRQIVDRALVEDGLDAGQRAEGGDLRLVGQVGDDPPVGLQAPEEVRAEQPAQRPVAVLLARRHATGCAPKLLRAAQQARLQEVEERPEVAEPVLDGRAGQRHANACSHGLRRARLPGAGVLDGLRLVEDDEPPFALAEPRGASHGTVRRDDGVDLLEGYRLGRDLTVCDGVGATFPAFGLARRRPVRHVNAQARREARGLRRPVGDQGRRDDEQGRSASRRTLAKEQEREHLKGLAEAHVVREANAEAQLVSPPEPADAIALVGTEDRLEVISRVRSPPRFGRVRGV